MIIKAQEDQMSRNNHHHKNTAGSPAGGVEESKESSLATEEAMNAEAGQSSSRVEPAENPSEIPAEIPIEKGEKEAGVQNEMAIEQKYAELEVKFAELNDQYLRKAADFENFRKRMIKEKQETIDFSNQSLILELLPVIDDFQRAIKYAKTSHDFTSFYDGVVMIEKRLSSDLENKWGLKSFDSEGQPFDPNRHEALQMEKVTGIQEAMVKDDFVKGYLLKDKVIRFAKVKVLIPDETQTG